MLELIDINVDNAVAFRLSGKVTKEDMSVVLSTAKQKIERYGDIVIFKQINSFEGVEIAAIVEEFKYLFDVGLSNIKKVAILTDKEWLETAANIEAKIFKSIEVRCFSLDEQLQATMFLKEGC